MKDYPVRHGIADISLNGTWDFAFFEHTLLEDVDVSQLRFTDLMTVPGCFDTTPAYRCKRGCGVYRKKFLLHESFSGGVIRFGAVGLRGRFFIDGQDIGEWKVAFTPFDLELPPLAEGWHELICLIDSNLDAGPDFSAPEVKNKIFLPYYDFYGFGGIYRDVELLLVNEPAIDRVQVRTLDISCGKVELRFMFLNEAAGTFPVQFRFDGQGEFTECEVAHGGSVTACVKDFHLWSCEDPFMHTVEVRCGSQILTERFGIRTIAVSGKKILLNGREIYLKGFNRHESHPEFGAAVPEQVMLEDLQNLKALHCNFIRGSHYPQSQKFLDLCDAMGMLVWEESLGWGNEADQIGGSEFQYWTRAGSVQMVRNSINHPSVIIWGFLNENHSETETAANFDRDLAELIKSEDKSRLVTFACCHPFDDQALQYMDILTYNIYPGWIGKHLAGVEPPDEIAPMQERVLKSMRERISSTKPLLVSEMGCCGIYGQHDIACTQWSEEFQAEYLESVIKNVFSASEEICGLTIWQFTDAMSYHRTGADIRCKPLGLNLAGVFDGFRRRKLAAGVVGDFFKNK